MLGIPLILLIKYIALVALAMFSLFGKDCYADEPVLRNPFTGDIIQKSKVDKIVVLVTGSSSGIGRDTAIEFARDSRFKVYATMRDPQKANFTKASLSKKQEGIQGT